MKNILTTTIYVRRSKEINCALHEKLKLDEKIMDHFKSMGNEIEIAVWIDKDTGTTWATKINDMPLVQKVRI